MRETEQLFAAARHYLAQADEILKRREDLASRTIGDMGRGHMSRSLSHGEMALAHLGSAAVRLATICEIAGYRLTPNYRTNFYNRDGSRKASWSARQIRQALVGNPNDHLHLMLRDNVAHEEPGISNTKHIAADRAAVLRNTTISNLRKGSPEDHENSRGCNLRRAERMWIGWMAL
jgi:hypothetical protein